MPTVQPRRGLIYRMGERRVTSGAERRNGGSLPAEAPRRRPEVARARCPRRARFDRMVPTNVCRAKALKSAGPGRYVQVCYSTTLKQWPRCNIITGGHVNPLPDGCPSAGAVGANRPPSDPCGQATRNIVVVRSSQFAIHIGVACSVVQYVVFAAVGRSLVRGASHSFALTIIILLLLCCMAGPRKVDASCYPHKTKSLSLTLLPLSVRENLIERAERFFFFFT